MSSFLKLFSSKKETSDNASPTPSETVDKQAAEDNKAVPADEADEVLPEDNRSLLLQLISKNGLSMGMDLSKVALPTFILEPRSLLEKLSDIVIHPEILTDIPKHETPEERMRAVVRWYLSAYHVRPRGTKKPFNPVLGETFSATFAAAESSGYRGTLHWTAQQVSHHPPVSAFFARDDAATVIIQGCFAPKSKFLGNSAASMAGGAFRIFLPQHGEVYYMNWPNVYVRGVLFGTLLMEICGNVVITCPKTNLTALIDFQAKGFFGGTHHHVSGSVFRGMKDDKKKGEQLYTIDGYWTAKTTVRAAGAPAEAASVLFDPDSQPLGKIAADTTAAAVDAGDAGPNEKRSEHHKAWPSRQIWSAVAVAIQESDQDSATAAKQGVEQYQRDLRQVRDSKGEQYRPTLFRQTGDEVTSEWEYTGPDAVPMPQ